ncbi:ABC transporter permease [Clostridium sp. DL1XJH146]
MRNNAIGIVFKKEIIEIFRDKKTIIVSILLPLILFPLLSFVMGNSMNESTDNVENNLNIAIEDRGNSNVTEILISNDNINITKVDDIKESVKNGEIYVGVIIPENFDENLKNDKVENITMIYDNSSQESTMAKSMIQSFLDSYSQQIVKKRLDEIGLESNILTPFTIENQTIEKEEAGFAKMMLTMILPLLLILYSVAGTLAPATDLGAGEKERGTLEPLLTTKVNRMSLLWGKFLAISVMGVIMSVVALLGLWLTTLQQNGIFSDITAAEITLSPIVIVFLILLPILTTMIFGALGLALSIYARSFKEAQTYITPLTIVALMGSYSTMMADPKNIDEKYFHIPIANTVSLLKELIYGIVDYKHIIITLVWTVIYVFISIIWARYMFNKESVIFRS